MKKKDAVFIVAGNWRLWQRLPRLAADARIQFPCSVGIEDEKKELILTRSNLFLPQDST